MGQEGLKEKAWRTRPKRTIVHKCKKCGFVGQITHGNEGWKQSQTTSRYVEVECPDCKKIELVRV